MHIIQKKKKQTIYAQTIKLHENNLIEKRSNIIWLASKANIGVTDNSKKYIMIFLNLMNLHIFLSTRD